MTWKNILKEDKGILSNLSSKEKKKIKKILAAAEPTEYFGQDFAKMGELVDKQLAKLGKIENLAASLEGGVFEYPPGSDRIYKLTGAFAMANQIIGRARRMPKEETVEEAVLRKYVSSWIGIMG